MILKVDTSKETLHTRMPEVLIVNRAVKMWVFRLKMNPRLHMDNDPLSPQWSALNKATTPTQCMPPLSTFVGRTLRRLNSGVNSRKGSSAASMRTKVYAKRRRTRIKTPNGWDSQNNRDWEEGNTIFHFALPAEYN